MVPTDAGLDALEPVHEVRFAYGAAGHTAADARQKRNIIAESLVVLTQLLTMLRTVAAYQDHVALPVDREALIFDDVPPTVVNMFAAHGQSFSIQPERSAIVDAYSDHLHFSFSELFDALVCLEAHGHQNLRYRTL